MCIISGDKIILKNELENTICAYVATFQSNEDCTHRWGRPLIGIACADDRLFRDLPKIASHGHVHPKDLLSQASSVIVVYIPFLKEEVMLDSKKEQLESWGTYYYETNNLLEGIGAHISSYLEKYGEACYPILPTHDFDKETLMCSWSHRHVAYIAGLGTFGLNRMLITDAGCCGRMVSIITTAKIPRSLREGKENCIYFKTGGCKICVGNCPTGALTENGFDRHLCYSVLKANDEKLAGGGKKLVCGECARNIPCMFARQ